MVMYVCGKCFYKLFSPVFIFFYSFLLSVIYSLLIYLISYYVDMVNITYPILYVYMLILYVHIQYYMLYGSPFPPSKYYIPTSGCSFPPLLIPFFYFLIIFRYTYLFHNIFGIKYLH